MSNIVGIIFAILVFSFIVIFHELGHFTLAKKMELMWKSLQSEWDRILFQKSIREQDIV